MLDRLFIGEGDSAPTDPNFENVTLLLHGDGSNGKQNNTFLDSSTNNFTITRYGDVTQGSFSPFTSKPYDPATNGGSGYFDGAGDYLSIPNSANLQFGSGNFTIEFWLYVANTTGNKQIINTDGPTSGVNTSYAIYASGSSLLYYLSSNGTSWNVASGASIGSISANTWYHVALVRNGNTFTPYLNGVAGATTTSSAALYNFTSAPNIGQFSNTDYLNGYLSNLRIVKGTAVYTSNFTPPTAPVTAITNTSLLLNFTNAGIVDASAKNDLVTVGNAQISTAQSKFGGGSIAFDGTGDYLTTPYNENFDLGSTYTIEAWVYPTTTSGFKVVFSIEAAVTANFASLILSADNGAAYFEVRPTTGWAVTSISGGSLSLNAWTHFAISVSNGSGKLFVNGTQVGSTTSIPNLQTRQFVGVGGNGNGFNPDGNSWVGYIDDLRVTKGIARYTSNFTPPTAPFADK